MRTSTINIGCKNAGREQSTNIGRIKKLCLKALQIVQKGNATVPVFLKLNPLNQYLCNKTATLAAAKLEGLDCEIRHGPGKHYYSFPEWGSKAQ